MASDDQSVSNLGEPVNLGDPNSQVDPMNTTSNSTNCDAMVNHAVPLNYSHDGLDNSHLVSQLAESTVTTSYSQHDAVTHGAMAHDAMPHGAITHDAMPHGAMALGAMAHGAMTHAAVTHSDHQKAPEDGGIYSNQLTQQQTQGKFLRFFFIKNTY